MVHVVDVLLLTKAQVARVSKHETMKNYDDCDRMYQALLIKINLQRLLCNSEFALFFLFCFLLFHLACDAHTVSNVFFLLQRCTKLEITCDKEKRFSIPLNNHIYSFKAFSVSHVFPTSTSSSLRLTSFSPTKSETPSTTTQIFNYSSHANDATQMWFISFCFTGKGTQRRNKSGFSKGFLKLYSLKAAAAATASIFISSTMFFLSSP